MKYAALALILSATAAMAQSHGSHFIENWDLDGDGIVTLDEATQKREDVFTAFDSDEDGQLSDAEYTMFDEMRAIDQEGLTKPKNNPEEAGMARAFNDADGDGQVSRAEFIGATAAWIAKMDRSGDGVITRDDFGKM